MRLQNDRPDGGGSGHPGHYSDSEVEQELNLMIFILRSYYEDFGAQLWPQRSYFRSLSKNAAKKSLGGQSK